MGCVIRNNKLLVSGPWVSDLEVDYAASAARGGWQERCFDYINRFEEEAKRVLGVKYAIATSSCHGALHLSLLALGIGAGDEVIVPESTWVATANAVLYVGATPVFVDVDPVSWTISPECILSAITPKTKAIIPVHLYGHACDMLKIMRIAEEHGLSVIEDAAQALGGEVCGQKTGSIGDAGCFSFHGSKAPVMGEGGLLVTNNEELYKKALLLSDLGKHPTKRFFCTELGYKYKLSNMQAAFGLAQLERIDEIIDKKIELFNWYQEFLGGLPGVKLNARLFDCKNTYWMVTMVLPEGFKISADEFGEELYKRNIDTRPFFYPLSTMSMYKKPEGSAAKNAVYLFERSLNLPSGVMLTREDIRYVCEHIREIISPGGCGGYAPSGELEYRLFFEAKLIELKSEAEAAGVKIQNVNYIDRAFEAAAEAPGGAVRVEAALAIAKALMAKKVFIRCFLNDLNVCNALDSAGFSELVRVPVKRFWGKTIELIKAPFTEPDDYLVTYCFSL